MLSFPAASTLKTHTITGTHTYTHTHTWQKIVQQTKKQTKKCYNKQVLIFDQIKGPGSSFLILKQLETGKNCSQCQKAQHNPTKKKTKLINKTMKHIITYFNLYSLGLRSIQRMTCRNKLDQNYMHLPHNLCLFSTNQQRQVG